MACDRLQPCPKCPRARFPVPGDGPRNARVVGIAESPGRDEDKDGIPFRGKTGKEINQLYLPMAGLERPMVYLTNAIKCWPRSDRDISDEILYSCAEFHLKHELQQLNPEIIVLMGAVACSLVDINVEMHHGRPRRGILYGKEYLLWPMYHPSLGMHDYAMMDQIMEDWRDLGRFLNGEELTYPVDQFPEPHYARLHTAADVRGVFDAGKSIGSIEPWDPLAIDTEFDPAPQGDIPYCLTFSFEPGTGWLIKAEDEGAVREFSRMVCGDGVAMGTLSPTTRFKSGASLKRTRASGGWRGPILMHNEMADIPVTHSMGVPIDPRRVIDTMVMAYHLGNVAQALKVLAWRLCGMEMVEFDDLVTPYALDHWVAFAEMISQVQWPKLDPYMRMVPEKIVEEVDGVPVVMGTQMVEKLYKPQSLTTKLKRLLTDYKKNPSPKVFKRWWEWDDVEKEPVIARFGDMPKKSIRMVSDEQELLNYACRDADATLRIWPILRRIRKEHRRKYRV